MSSMATATTTTTTTTTPMNSQTSWDIVNNIEGTHILILVILAIVIYFVFKRTASDGETDGEPGGGMSIFILLVAFAVIIASFKLYKSLDISTSLQGAGTSTPQLDININQLTGTSGSPSGSNTGSGLGSTSVQNQVFNIPGNYYTYDSAKAVCDAYDADLATYEQVEKAYNSGAEWCNYGWSDGQMALFPTQTASYNKLQQIPGHEHDCGRPGVNGGYIANPNVKFGVNCYGKKPKITQYESDLMKTQSPYPITEKDILFEKQVNYWKSKINDILISPFNYTSWSKV